MGYLVNRSKHTSDVVCIAFKIQRDSASIMSLLLAVCFHPFFILVANNTAPQTRHVTEKRGLSWRRVLEELQLVTTFLLADP